MLSSIILRQFTKRPENIKIITSAILIRNKQTIDKSKIPVLNEEDLEENFIKGNGPGGSNVNTNSNCVTLLHKPTGIIIKCHQARLLEKNRELAREMLVDKLDQFYNGEDSVLAQKKKILEKKSLKRESKRKKLENLKQSWKERELNIVEKS